MTAVRGFRLLAFLLAGVLAVAGVVFGAAWSAFAATPQTVVGHIEDAGGNDLGNVEVIVADGVGTYYSDLTDANGDYSIGLPDEDWYTIDAGSDAWVWQYTDVYVDGTEGSIDFILEPGVAISGVVTDIADNSFVGFVDVFAIPVNVSLPSGYIDFHGPTDASDGIYSITVPLNDDYILLAYDQNDDYDPQVYLGHNLSGCLCDPDLVSIITTPPPTPKNFQLYGYADWVHVSIYALRNPVPDVFDGLLVTLQRKNTVTGLWDSVSSAATDATGTVDLYGRGAGEYRVVYSESGIALAAADAEDYYTGSPYPLSDAGKTLEFGMLTPPAPGGGGCGCGGGPGAFTERIVDLLFPEAIRGGSGGGGSTSTPPRRPRTTVSSLIGDVIVSTSTPTPSATPTSSPTPSASQSSDPSPSPSSTPPPVVNQGFDVWWLWLVLAGIVALIVFFLVRLIRGRA